MSEEECSHDWQDIRNVYGEGEILGRYGKICGIDEEDYLKEIK